MRIGYGLIAGSLVLAWAVGSASSQTPKQIDPGQIQTVAPPPAAVSDLRVRPVADGNRPYNPITTVKTLDENECKTLGGAVEDDHWKVCRSGKICVRIDNYGTTHAVCLSASI